MDVHRPEVGKDKKNKEPRGRNSGFLKPSGWRRIIHLNTKANIWNLTGYQKEN